jgi:hypothetical protein
VVEQVRQPFEHPGRALAAADAASGVDRTSPRKVTKRLFSSVTMLDTSVRVKTVDP